MQQSVFQTLADPTRLRIVEALAGGEQAVGDLVRPSTSISPAFRGTCGSSAMLASSR